MHVGGDKRLTAATVTAPRSLKSNQVLSRFAKKGPKNVFGGGADSAAREQEQTESTSEQGEAVGLKSISGSDLWYRAYLCARARDRAAAPCGSEVDRFAAMDWVPFWAAGWSGVVPALAVSRICSPARGAFLLALGRAPDNLIESSASAARSALVQTCAAVVGCAPDELAAGWLGCYFSAGHYFLGAGSAVFRVILRWNLRPL